MKKKPDRVLYHYHGARRRDEPDEDPVEPDEDAADGSRVIGHITSMQYAALCDAAEGKQTPGCSKAAQYLRLRRAKAALGIVDPPKRRAPKRRSRKTKSISVLGGLI